MTNPVIGSTSSFSRTKTSRSYPRHAFSFLRTQREPNFIRQKLSRESEQPAPEVSALIFRCDEQLVKIEIGQMQRQHRRERSAFIGDKQAPALLDLERNARAQFRQQEIAGVLEPRGGPAVHPDTGDLVIFVCPGGTDCWRRHRGNPCGSNMPAHVAVSDFAGCIHRARINASPTINLNEFNATATKHTMPRFTAARC